MLLELSGFSPATWGSQSWLQPPFRRPFAGEAESRICNNKFRIGGRTQSRLERRLQPRLAAPRQAPLRSASMRGTRLLGLSRLNDRASPSCVRTYCSVRSTAFSRSLFLGTKAVHAIDSADVSYS